VAWQHEFGDTAYSVVASLASGAGNSFTVFGPQIGRDSHWSASALPLF
jgi:hypothetical protein